MVSKPLLSISSGTVYVLTTDGTLYALDASDGSTNRSSNLNGSDPTSPVLHRGRLYLSTSEELLSVDSDEGSVVWSYETGASSGMSPSVDDSGVYFADAGYVHRLRRWDGEELWSTYIGGSLNSVVIDGENVYVASGSIGSYSKRSGQKMWSTGARGNVVGRPGLHDGVLYLATDTGNLQAIDTDGNGLWTVELGREALGGPCVIDDTVYAVFAEGFSGDSTFLNAVSTSDGESTSQYDVGSGATAGSVVADGTVYVGTDSGVYALGEDKPVPPSASFKVSPENPSSGDTVTFDASPTSSGDSRLERYEWTFETANGPEEATGQTVQHTFSEGSWDVGLRVVDSGGLSDTANLTLQVTDAERGGATSANNADGDGGSGDQRSETGGESDSESSFLILGSLVGLGGLLLVLNRYLSRDSDQDDILDRYNREE
jgi:hypothetical protein